MSRADCDPWQLESASSYTNPVTIQSNNGVLSKSKINATTVDMKKLLQHSHLVIIHFATHHCRGFCTLVGSSNSAAFPNLLKVVHGMETVVLTQELEHLDLKDYHTERLYSVCLKLAPERAKTTKAEMFSLEEVSEASNCNYA